MKDELKEKRVERRMPVCLDEDEVRVERRMPVCLDQDEVRRGRIIYIALVPTQYLGPRLF